MSIKRELTVDYVLSKISITIQRKIRTRGKIQKQDFEEENMKLKWKFQRTEVFKLKDLLQKGYFS